MKRDDKVFNRLSKILRTPSEIQLNEEPQWVIVKSQFRAQLSIRFEDELVYYDTFRQACTDKFGTINTMCQPPTSLLVAQLKVETSKLLPPPLLTINNVTCLESDSNIVYDPTAKCMVNKITNIRLDGYNLPPTLLTPI